MAGKIWRGLWKFYTWKERNRWTLGVFAAIFDLEGKLLLVRQRGREKWSLPGGGVGRQDAEYALRTGREDEVFSLALFRELKEEIGLSDRHILRITAKEMFASCKLQDIAVVYLFQVDEEALSNLMPKEEIEEIGFFLQDNLPLLLGPRMERMVGWAFDQYYRALG